MLLVTARAAAVLALLSAAAPVLAGTIVADTSGNQSSRFQFYWGQSFTTPAGTGWNNISFNFYDLSLAPYAAGQGYLFGRAYAGTPAGLAAAGALAVSAVANGSSYDFAPAVRLRPGRTYYFYADAPMRLRGGGVTDVGGSAVFTQFGSQAYASAGGRNADFQVSGTSLAVPEPEGWSLLLTGFAIVGGIRRRTTTRFINGGATA